MNATMRRQPEISFLTSGKVTGTEVGTAEREIREALEGARGSVTSVQVTLSLVDDPSCRVPRRPKPAP